MIDHILYFLTTAMMVLGLLFVICFWIILLKAIVWPEIKAVYIYYKEQRNVPSDPS